MSEGTTTTYLRGINLICTDEYYYVFDAHGDVVNLTDASGNTVKTYEYDAFGVEKNCDDTDTNPFRYCGEYWDSETETYYLRARYYDPNLGRFASQDTHWNVSNMIYGDNPQKINEREDMLGLTTYSYAPQISVITQSCNLYVYCINDPVAFFDPTGELTWKGEIHNAVGMHIAGITGKYREVKISYSDGSGRVDLIDLEGNIWEIKPDNPRQIAKGMKQLKNYIEKGIECSIGLCTITKFKVGGKIASGEFYYPEVNPKYRVSYRYVNGVIAYSYTEIKTEEEKKAPQTKMEPVAIDKLDDKRKAEVLPMPMQLAGLSAGGLVAAVAFSLLMGGGGNRMTANAHRAY